MPAPTEILQLINSSGNSFHAKVARWLSEHGWNVVISPYYMDETQNKAREIDLIAERLWPTSDSFGRETGDVAIRLFIECKFVPSPSVFWMTGKNMNSAMALVCRNSPFRPNNTYTQKHHYLASSPAVAKLFTTAGRGPDSEPFYKALNQALNALVAMRGETLSLWSGTNRPAPIATLEFPVVVCSSFDQMFSVDFYAESEPTPVTENFQLEVRYAYIHRNENRLTEDFLLDFVEFSQLEKFGAALNDDAEAAVFLAS
jgi:hypothetical protein